MRIFRKIYTDVALINNDFAWGISLLPMIMKLAMGELRAKYKRTMLGPFWIVISLAFGSVGLSFLWSHLWNVPYEDIIPNITLGFLVWMFIVGTIVDSTVCFTNSSSLIQNLKLPVTFFPLLCVVRQFLTFLHSLVIVVVVIFIFPPKDPIFLLIFPPGLFLVSVTLLLISFFIGAISARFRDIPPLVTSIMPMLFFLTPVLFRIQQAGDIAWLIWLNPFTYFITLLRDPLSGYFPGVTVILISLAICVFSYVALCIVVAPKLRKIVFWI